MYNQLTAPDLERPCSAATASYKRLRTAQFMHSSRRHHTQTSTMTSTSFSADPLHFPAVWLLHQPSLLLSPLLSSLPAQSFSLPPTPTLPGVSVLSSGCRTWPGFSSSQSPPLSPCSTSAMQKERTSFKSKPKRKRMQTRAEDEESANELNSTPSSPSYRSPPPQRRGQKREAENSACGPHVLKWTLHRPRYKRSKVEVDDGSTVWKRCAHCGTDSTPEWRAGPLGKGTLCNACGLRFSANVREQKRRKSVGRIPMSMLLNPDDKKGRPNNHPMIWETKVTLDSPDSPDWL